MELPSGRMVGSIRLELTFTESLEMEHTKSKESQN